MAKRKVPQDHPWRKKEVKRKKTIEEINDLKKHHHKILKTSSYKGL